MFNKTLITFFLLLVHSITFSQLLINKEAEKKVTNSNKILLNQKNKSIEFLRLNDNANVSITGQDQWLKNTLGLTSKHDLKIKSEEKDKLGTTHKKFQIYYNGIPVEGNYYTTHERKGKIISANGKYTIGKDISTKPEITEFSAFTNAKEYLKAKIYHWESLKTERPTGELVLLPSDSSYTLAYKYDIWADVPMNRQYIYIDAIKGKFLRADDRIHVSDVIGHAETLYNGTVDITTDSYNGSYRLRETSRGNGIETYNLNNGTTYSAGVDFTDTDNTWTNNTNNDKAAYDAHYATEATYDYYFTKFGRNSYDNQGSKMISYVHYDRNYVNAFWNGSYMSYGDGDGTNYLPLTPVEVVGHEITHGVIEHTCGLNYQGESGALNESFADIFGVSIDFFRHPTTANFLMGDAMSTTHTPFRSMVNPKAYGDPDTYHGTNWESGTSDNGGVHTNSGVQNHWFYLLCQGGNGTNDIGSTYSVTGIGIEKASQIAYRSMTVYLSPTSGYSDARFYSIQAAVDLFGDCSQEVIAVANAWYAVGVGAIYDSNVKADFVASQTNACNISNPISFYNRTTNGETYVWDFGDGQTSTDKDPSHTYSHTGTYSISLTARGKALCNSSDTETKTDYIDIKNGNSLVQASCKPATTIPSTGGIYNFAINDISHQTHGSFEGYQDFSCSYQTTLTEGSSYSFNMTVGNLKPENIAIWIDLNNDGIFDEQNELAYQNSGITGSFSDRLAIPAGIQFNTPIRLRIGTDFATNAAPSPCTDSQNGQFHDYAVIITPNTQAPTANFASDKSIILKDDHVSFVDKSENLPTSWQWSFPGGTPSSSTLKNPTIKYPSTGTYDVSLTVSNRFGTQSITKTSHIVVLDQLYCTSNLGGGGCPGDISAFSITGTSLNNNNHTNCSNANGSAYLLFPASGNNTTNLDASKSYEFSVTTTNQDNISIWIDYNMNGIFEDSEWTQVTSYSIPGTPSKINIVIPTNAKGGTTGLRIRTRSAGNTNGSSDACTNFGSGITEDYFIKISPPIPAVPVANFRSYQSAVINEPVQFTDQSSGVPTTWLWSFQGGASSITTSTLQNPTVSYNAAGTYDVSLTASNALGTNTVNKMKYINIIAALPGESCANAQDLSLLTSPFNGTTTSYKSDFTLCNTSGTPDRIFFIDVPPSKQLTIGQTSNDFDSRHSLRVGGSCPGTTEIACIDDPDTQSHIYYNTTSSTVRAYFIIGGFSQSSYGSFTLAWDISSPPPPNANFRASQTEVSPNTTVYFSDLSTNSPTSWLWTFSGENGSITTSSLQNPSVTYNAEGTYSVSLTVSNASGSSTAVKTNYINVSKYCINSLGGGGCPGDITNVSIIGTNLSNSNHANCSNNSYSTIAIYPETSSTIINRGNTYHISVTTTNSDIISLWIDYNQNGVFEANEWTQITKASTPGTASEAAVTIPLTALTGKTQMRVRTNSSYNTNGSNDACSYFQYGITEDYYITIGEAIPSAPVADFVSNQTVIKNEPVQFYDLSNGVPTSWQWSFEGGAASIATSSLQNPSVSYNAAGTYDVSLIASNSLGSNKKVKIGYITVVEAPPGENCANAQDLSTLTSPYSGTTNEYKSDFTLCGMTGSSDRIFYIDVPSNKQLTIGQSYNDFDSRHTLRVGGTCPGTTEITCVDDPDNQTQTYTNTTGATVRAYFIIGGYSSSSRGNFTLEWKIGDPPPPVAEFNANQTLVSPGTAIYFYDQSVNLPTSWLWSFEGSDGSISSSSLQNPSVTFNAEGTYTVSLTSTNMFGSNTISKSDFITVSKYCLYNLGGGGCNGNITNLSIQGTSLNNSNHSNCKSTNWSFYSRYPATGSMTATLLKGSSYLMTITDNFNELASVWIDYNQNGSFDADELSELKLETTSGIPAEIILSIPAAALTGQTRMRIRTYSPSNYNSYLSACTYLYSGITEDYTVSIAEGTTARPISDFYATKVIYKNDPVKFTDLSSGSPTSWLWSFQGGASSISTSSLQNPTVSYSVAGTYDVALTSTNALGSNSVTKNGYIIVNNPLDGESCENAQDLSNLTSPYNGTTTGYRSNFTFCGMGDAPDRIFYIDVPAFKQLSIGLQYCSFYPKESLRIGDGCPGSTEVFCIAGYDGQMHKYINTTSNTIRAYFIVSGYNSYDKGSFSISWNLIDAPAPVANFYSYQSTTSPGGTINFYDQSENSPTDWLWTFTDGDGVSSTSSLKNPSITFPSEGMYTVSLTASNSLGTNTITKPDFIIISKYCTTYLGGSCPSDISNVSFSNTSLNNSNHTDCRYNNWNSAYRVFPKKGSTTTMLRRGSTYQLNVTPTNPNMISVWIDYNQNGYFETSEWTQVATSSVSGVESSVSITIPNSALNGTTHMRIRTSSIYNYQGSYDACSYFWSGVTEDYIVTIVSEYLTLSSNAIAIPAEASITNSFDISANVDWTINSDQTWLSTSEVSGSNNSTINLFAEANPTTSSRSAVITVSGTYVSDQTLTVTQAAGAAVLTISQNTLKLSDDANSEAKIGISSNVNWQVSNSESWLSTNATDGFGTSSLKFVAQANTNVNSRTAIVKISGTGVADQTITVTQDGYRPKLSTTTNEITLQSSFSNDKTIDILSNTKWTAVCNQTWLSFVNASATGNGPITLIGEENLTATSRRAIITISATGVADVNITVTQDAAITSLSILPNMINMAAANAAGKFEIRSNTSWSMQTQASWLSFTPSTSSGNAAVSLTAEDNLSFTSRSAILILSSAGLADMTITVTQESAVPFLNVPSKTITIPAAANSVKSSDITANIEWSVTSNQPWLIVSRSSATGNSNLTMTAEANLSVNTRTALVKISGTGVAEQLITVTQEAAAPILNISNSNVTLAAAANSTLTVDLTSNTNWTVISNQAWLSLSQSNGSGNSPLTMTGQANTSNLSRVATVTISAVGIPNKQISVTQEGKALSVDYIGNQNILVFPNPTDAVLNIKGAEPNAQFSILDLNGKLLFEGELTENKIDVSKLNEGFFILKITEKTKVTIRRFVKQ